jgi:hypothetical protein
MRGILKIGQSDHRESIACELNTDQTKIEFKAMIDWRAGICILPRL